ncbi:hypothetical protein TNCV_4298521 [Trichonephila clavipes]|nr:hypothetical protein TNCV_4298521 [Trichonephila clavipes]
MLFTSATLSNLCKSSSSLNIDFDNGTLQFLDIFFEDNLLELIVCETNKYANWIIRNSKDLPNNRSLLHFTKANDRRTSCPCHDEFRGPHSDYVRQVALATTTTTSPELEDILLNHHTDIIGEVTLTTVGLGMSSSHGCVKRMVTFRRMGTLNNHQAASRVRETDI